MYDRGVAGGTVVATNSILCSHGCKHCSNSVRTSSRAV